jgi:hypothetical protein
MEPASSTKSASQLARQLSNLKIVSRLLAHELHAQSSSKSITLSKEEVVEVQTCIDLFIEEMTRTKGGAASAVPAETTLVGSRN